MLDPLRLSELQKNEVAYITNIGCHGYSRHQLLSLGIAPGMQVKMIRCAPLGDPIEFEVLKSKICLRKQEANLITITK